MSQLPFFYIRWPGMLKACGGISRSKAEALIAQGLLPKPYKLGARTVVWRSDEVEAALAALPKIETAYERSSEARKARRRSNDPA